MVKFNLFGYELRNPFKRLEFSEAIPRALSAEASQGLFFRDSRDVYRVTETSDYYDAYFDNDMVRAPIDDLVESGLGQGWYTTVETGAGERSKKLCDDFGKFFNLDDLLVNIGKETMIAGFCPVETRALSADFEDIALKIVHPNTVHEIGQTGAEPLTIEWLQQKPALNKPGPKIEGDDLAWFIYGRVGNDPRGVSYVRTLLDILNILDSSTDSVDKILDRYIAPIGIWKQQRGRDLGSLKRAVLERLEGEDIFLGDLTAEEMAEKIVEFISIDPHVPFWEYIEYLDRRVYSYTRANNLYYSKDATVASAETLDDIVGRHVRALQRAMKRSVERYWYTPLVVNTYGVDAEIPRLNFGEEQTGLEDIQIEPFITQGLTAMDAQGPYLTRNQYYDLMNQFGLTLAEPEIIGPLAMPEAEEEDEESDGEDATEYVVRVGRKESTHEEEDC